MRLASHGRRLEQKQIERDHIPQRWKTAKVIPRQFHVPIGEIECGSDYYEGPGGQRESHREESTGADRIGRDEYVSDKIDNEIEHISGPARQNYGNLEVSRNGTVDAIDDERDSKAEKHGRPLRCHRKCQCGECHGGSGSGENMHPESAGLGRRSQKIGS